MKRYDPIIIKLKSGLYPNMVDSENGGYVKYDDVTAEIENMKRCGICDNYKARRGLCHIDNDIVNRADKCRFNPSEWEMVEE